MIQAGLGTTVVEQVNNGEIAPSSLVDLIQAANFTLIRLEEALAEPLENAQGEILSLEQLRGLMETGARLRSLEQEHSPTENALQTDFGRRFKRFETDWLEINTSLAWTDRFLEIVGQTRLSPGLSEHAREPKEASFYQNVADRAEVAIEEAESQIAHVKSNYDIAQGPWDSWEQAKFEEIKVWSQELSQDADSASDWLLYRQALTDLDHMV